MTVTWGVPGLAPVIETGVVTEHVMYATGLEQTSATDPVNPFAGLIVSVEEPVAPAASDRLAGLSDNVTGATTVRVDTADTDAAKFPLAANEAVMLSVPTVRLVSTRVAIPFVTVPVPSVVAPFRNDTMPVEGAPAAEATEAVRVTDCPANADPADKLNVVVVTAAETVSGALVTLVDDL